MKPLTFNCILGCLVASATTAPISQVGSPHLQQYAGRTVDAATMTRMGYDGAAILKRHAQAITTRQLGGLTSILGSPKPSRDGQNGRSDRKPHVQHGHPVDTQSTKPKDKVDEAATEADGRHDTNKDGGDEKKSKKGGLLGLGLLG